MGNGGHPVGAYAVGAVEFDSITIEDITFEDVVFDHTAAERAVRELRRSATALDDLLAERERARLELLTIWMGPAATDHAELFLRTQRETHGVADRLRREAHRIEDAAGLARHEQRRREEDAAARQLAAMGVAW